MRQRYLKQLEALHVELIRMGALCEEAISSATKSLMEGNNSYGKKAINIEQDINIIERNIEQMCIRLLLHEQPVASDLRRVTAAQMIIVDMERIGDQAEDIAEISVFMKNSSVKSNIRIEDMANATIKMVTDSVDAFVSEDVIRAQAVIDYDDIVDNLFITIKKELIELLQKDTSLASECLDLLMVAKYLERIGDHAVNVAEWVLYFITGDRYGNTTEAHKE